MLDLFLSFKEKKTIIIDLTCFALYIYWYLNRKYKFLDADDNCTYNATTLTKDTQETLCKLTNSIECQNNKHGHKCIAAVASAQLAKMHNLWQMYC